MSASGRGARYRGLADYYTPPDLPPAVLAAFRLQLLADGVDPRALRYLEGHVGGAAWLRGLYHPHFTRDGSNIEIMDLDPNAAGLLLPGGHTVQVADRGPSLVDTGFIITDPVRTPDVVIGNPPYGIPKPCAHCAPNAWTPGPGCKRCKGKGTKGVQPLAAAHVRRGLQLARHVVFLLRVGFLGSWDRHDLWPYLRHVWILTPRVQFAQVCGVCQGIGLSPLEDDGCTPCGSTGRARGRSGSDSSEYAVFWFDRLQGGRPWTGSHVIWRQRR